MKMTTSEMSWLKLKWTKVREANHKADLASNEWNELNDAFKVWCESSGHTDPVVIARIKDQNLALKDALSAWDFFRRDADRHASAILAFKAMKDMEII